MRALLKFLLGLLALVAGGGAIAWYLAGRAGGPVIDLRQPERFIGQSSTLELTVDAPGGQFTSIDVTLRQGDRASTVYSMARPEGATVRQETAERIYIMRPVGSRTLPELQSGPAQLVVRAARPALFGLRTLESAITRDVDVRLQPPRVSVVSQFHFINHGGSEFVVYRVMPDDVESGVRVGDKQYRGYPASGAGIAGDAELRVAFFALLFDQDLNTPIQVFARDPAGNEAATPLDHRVFPRPYARSRIDVDDRFLARVVPAIAASAPGENIPTGDLVEGFLRINGPLREKNNQQIRDLAARTASEMLFGDEFRQLGSSKVEARFADARTYYYQGREIDRQVHLGFDLAVTANVPVLAANRGRVVHAGDLGIFGNCVVLDHGLGVQSLYAHLSSIDVADGALVEKGHVLGRSGMTGLAGGDHLHFTMLVGGEAVTPVDWWSRQWMQDRVLRKIAAAGGVQ